MRRINFTEKLKVLSVADRWLLALCVLPLIYFLRILYGVGKVQFYYIQQGDGLWLDRSLVYFLASVLISGFKALLPIVAGLKTSGRVPRPLFWIWLVLVLEGIAAALNYMRLIDTQQEDLRWTSEIHIVLRLLPFDVTEGYWIGILRVALWLAIAALFIRKCRKLKAERESQRVQSAVVA